MNKDQAANGYESIPLGDSWDDFYESYDGKFDERHILLITVHGQYRNDIEGLGI